MMAVTPEEELVTIPGINDPNYSLDGGNPVSVTDNNQQYATQFNVNNPLPSTGEWEEPPEYMMDTSEAPKTVDDLDTVENRLTGLINKDSDYMKLAETRALQDMNSRGILNSSLAVGAAHAAAIEAALPIAQQDSDARNKWRQQVRDYYHQKEMQNASMSHELESQTRGLLAEWDINQARMDVALRQSEMDNIAQQIIAQLEVDQKNYAAGMEMINNNQEWMTSAWNNISTLEWLEGEERQVLLEEMFVIQQNNLETIASLTGFEINWGAGQTDYAGLPDTSGGSDTSTENDGDRDR